MRIKKTGKERLIGRHNKVTIIKNYDGIFSKTDFFSLFKLSKSSYYYIINSKDTKSSDNKEDTDNSDNINSNDNNSNEGNDKLLIKEKIRLAIKDLREKKIFRGCKAMVSILKDEYGITTYKEKIYEIAKENGFLIGKNRNNVNNKYATKNRLPACKRLIKTGFRAKEPLKYFCTDVINLSYSFGTIKLSCVMDYYSRMIVCFHTSFHENSELANETLNLLEKFLPFKIENGIFHSDRAGIYRTHGFHDYLTKLNLKQSHSRPYKGSDNPFIEQFFHVLRDEFYSKRVINTLEEFNKEIEEWIHYYNYDRRYTNTDMTPFTKYVNYYKENRMEVPEINICFSHNNDKNPKRFRF